MATYNKKQRIAELKTLKTCQTCRFRWCKSGTFIDWYCKREDEMKRIGTEWEMKLAKGCEKHEK